MNERTIFLEALERADPIQQAAFLDTACAADASLRLRVESLLQSHDGAGSFLGKLAPERLAEELGVRASTGESLGQMPADDYGQALSILTPSDKPDSLGRLGSYEVQEVIGRGGMGIVLRAFDERLHRVVAIKVMTAPLAANAAARKRFTREARSAAAVSHDHVVTIHGVEETSDPPYLVMQYVSGVSLQERLDKSGPLQLHEILRIGMQTATGLAAAHAQGLVHRDIKPANILLENGVERVKITDFGLAHAVDDVRTTQPGTVIGTPEYMSPEQARGERVDHRSDLFSLGCVLYAMCAGRPPFRAESTVAIIRRVCDDMPRPLVEINSEIPEWLVDLIDKLIAKDASERFQSAAEVAELLGQYLAHLQQPAVNPQPAAITKPRPLRRRTSANARRRWSIAAAALLLLCVGLSLAETTGVTNVAATVIRIVRGDGTLVVDIDDPNIQVLIDGEELVIIGAGPKEIRLRPGQHKLDTAKDGRPLGTQAVTITKGGRQVVKVAREEPAPAAPAAPTTRLVWADSGDTSGAPSPDGRYLAFVDWETGDVAVRDLATGKNRRVTNKGPWSESSEFALWPMFSADGKQLAYTWYGKDAKSADLRLVQVEGGDPRVVYTNKGDGGTPETCAWTPDGKAILAKLHFYARGESRDSAAPAPFEQRRLQLALIATADGSVRVIKEGGGDAQMVKPTLAPGGRTIAYSRITEPRSANHDIFLIDVETGQETQVTTHVADKRILAWTPDGQRLLFDMERQGARDAWLIRIVGGKPQGEAELVRKDLGAIVPHGFTRDGAFYYTSSSRGPSLFTATLDLEKGAATATPLAAEKFNILDQLWLGDWSPDGEHLAYLAWSRASQERRIDSMPPQEMRIVSMKTGQTRVLKPDLTIVSFRWSPDGRSFIAAAFLRQRPGIYQIDAVSGQATAVVEPAGGRQTVWSRDGRGIFYVKRPSDAAGTFRILHRDLQAQTESDVLAPGNPVFNGKLDFWFDVSPDGRQLALLGKPNAESMVLWLIPVNGGASRELLKVNTPGTFAGGVGWTPDGRFVLFTQLGGDETQRGLWYISANGGEPRKVALTGIDARKVTRLAIHPDGKQLAFTATETGKSEVWALENFLPPLKDSASVAAADASAAKSKSPGSPDNAAAPVSSRPASPSTRLVWADAVDSSFSGAPSPDGKYVSYMDWTSGDVAIRDLATGTNRHLTKQGWPEYPGSSVFSPDSRQVAFSVLNKDGVHELRLIGLDGSGQRTLYPNQGKEVQYLVPSDWGADGKSILATFVKREAGQLLSQIVLISVEDGSLRILKTLDGSDPGKMVLSPDGHYVAYSAYPNKTSRQRNIFLLATDGSGAIPLVEHPADDHVLGWAPDGKRLVFASNRTGTIGIWLIAVAEGKPQGAPSLVKAEMGQFYALGLTHSGSLYYGLFSGGQNVYTATLDVEQGKLLTPPVEAIQHGEGFNWSPAWSPDGRYLACLSHRQGRPPLFYIRSVESNDVRELAPNLRGFNVHSLHWSPNGKSLLGAGSSEGEWGALQIDVQSAAVTTLVPGAGNGVFAPIPAPDGKTLFYQRNNPSRRLMRRDLESGVEMELDQTANLAAKWWGLSPDGRQLAASVAGALKLLPAAGGEPRELTKMKGNISAVAWTPDGRHLLFQRASQLWRIPVGGGEPQATGLTMKGGLGHLRVHPDGRQVAFAAHPQADKTEVWVLENFLPLLKDSAPVAAADDSAAKSKPAASAGSNAETAAAPQQPALASPSTRQVWAEAGNESGSVSPDGRHFAFIDWETSGLLAVCNLATGENRQLTTNGPYTRSPEFVDSPIFSPDGMRVAYTWYKGEAPGKWKYELRVIGIDGGDPKSLLSNTESFPEAYGWSPDANSILVGLYVKAELQLTFIGVADGSVRIVKLVDGGRGKVGNVSLSPDGRTIAYSRRAEPAAANRSIFLMDAGSGEETRATTHGTHTDVIAWTPDGRRLLFTIERQGARDAWEMRISGGKAQGAPRLVKTDLGNVSPLGFSSNGALFYGQSFSRPSAFTATLDLDKDTVTATSLPGESFSVMDVLSVEGWSPDGRYLAYKARTGDRRFEIRVLSVNDGQARSLQPDVQTLSAFHWSPDGESFITASKKEPGGPTGIYQIDSTTGKITALVEPEDGIVGAGARWAPDGRGIFYGKGRNGIIYRDVQNKSERVILAPGNADFASLRFDVSRDGRQLAVMGMAKDAGVLIVRLIAVEGGASQDLLRGDQKTGLGWVTWTPDGKGLLFTRYGPDENLRGLWYLSADGGQPRRLKVSGVEDSQILNMAVHPDGKQLAFTTSAFRRYEVWAMENFLPPLADPQPSAAADASAAKGK